MKLSISPRLTLLIIAAMFVMPLALAWMMYSGTLEFSPTATRNKGQLIEPPLSMNWQALQIINAETLQEKTGQALLGRWVVLYPLPATCEATCQQHIVSLRQIHLATGRNQSRVRLALILSDTNQPERVNELGAIYEKFTFLSDPNGELMQTLTATNAGNTYLIDPLGNIMMHYTAGVDPNYIMQDLKQLLTWSKLDEQ
jgi:cytochrome oxidase Cu insertion factor (SCO1/SenC/PrrC family)